MKNKEKYAKELIEFAIKGELVAMKNGKFVNCADLKCAQCDFNDKAKPCSNFRKEWAEAECIEPQIDWSKVKVDTPILVSNNNKTWRNRHFAKYEDGMFYAWNNGGTSWSNETCIPIGWKYAKLPEEVNEE